MIGLELYGPLSMRAERGCAGVGGAGEQGRAWGCVSSDFVHSPQSLLSFSSLLLTLLHVFQLLLQVSLCLQ